jgi:predicted transcriptional regulator
MKVTFDKEKSVWKIELEDKRHLLNTTDFLVLTGLRDRNDRKFHPVSELVFTSKLGEIYLKRGLNNLKKTSLINAKKNSYRISEIGEKVVDMIRKDEVEILNSKKNLSFDLDNLKRLLGFEAE